MRESARLPSTFDVTSMSWLVQPVYPQGDLEQLAQAQHVFDDARDLATVLGHGVLVWDFTQTAIEVGPLWIGKVEQSIQIPEHATFAVDLRFGPECPSIQREHAVRVCLHGTLKTSFQMGLY